MASGGAPPVGIQLNGWRNRRRPGCSMNRAMRGGCRWRIPAMPEVPAIAQVVEFDIANERNARLLCCNERLRIEQSKERFFISVLTVELRRLKVKCAGVCIPRSTRKPERCAWSLWSRRVSRILSLRFSIRPRMFHTLAEQASRLQICNGAKLHSSHFARIACG